MPSHPPDFRDRRPTAPPRGTVCIYQCTIPRLRAGRRIVLLLALGLLPGRAAARDRPSDPLEVEPEDLRPGLSATYRSLVDRGAAVRRVEPKPAFAMGRSSPHPRLPPGPFEVAWEGVIRLREPGPIAFHARLGGELVMEIDGVAVLRGIGRSDASTLEPSASFDRPPGLYRLSIRFRSLAEVPARLQIHWQGPSFAREPLPAWRLGHLAEDLPPEALRDELATRGRDAAGRLGCARCHSGAFPGLSDPPPGPSLADSGRRIRRDWLVGWLADPAKVKPGARMPALFSADRRGFVERWLVAEALAPVGDEARPARKATGDHRAGRIAFLGLGCAACHLVPDLDRGSKDADPGRTALDGLGDRIGADDLAAFLGNPHARYPDGRMPRLPVAQGTARDIAAYLLLWSRPTPDPPADPPPTEEEVGQVARRLGVRSRASASAALLGEKRCGACHPGLGATMPLDVPIVGGRPRGCLADGSSPHFVVDPPTREALDAYLAVAALERHPSPFAARQRRLERAGCVRCHQRDGDRPPPLEAIASTLGGAHLQALPFQRTPRLTHPHQKYTHKHLLTAVREGFSGLRPAEYSYRMPAFGPDADDLVRALAEADGELPDEADPPARTVEDPTLGTLAGPALVGSQGYSCISCHVWGGRQLAQPDPGAVGPDLTRAVGRIRRDWFDRFLEDPSRFAPGTPMPSIFEHGRPATLKAVLDGDPARQKDALWAYFAKGKDAPAPKPPPPVPVAGPAADAPPMVAQVPIRLPDGSVVESLCLLNGHHDLLIYDLASAGPHSISTGARILRDVQGRTRRFLASGTPLGDGLAAEPALQLVREDRPEAPSDREFLGYDRLADGARLRWRARFAAEVVEVEDTLRIVRDDDGGRLLRDLRMEGVPEGASASLRLRGPDPLELGVSAAVGELGRREVEGQVLTATLAPDRNGRVVATVRYPLPAARPAPAWEGKPSADAGPIEGTLRRPGYRAIAFPRPKTVSGEDRVMPGALAVRPRDGRVFVASMKTGEVLALDDPGGQGQGARFLDYTGGLFQEVFGMLAEDDALYVLHRRNLTRVSDADGDGLADRFDRVAALPHGVADTYDYAYGLVRDRDGGFLLSYAPYANTEMPGSGGALRLVPGRAPREVAFGFRNPLGWCTGPDGEVFFTDNQGEWVATNKLCHLEEGRFYGFPNPSQRRHADRPPGRAAVWVPYGWAKSINGVAYDGSGGQFGPFAGQFFLAELMFGGAILRADLERVNGRYQGACFPFWGKGLLGPVCLAFDPKGRLFVGGITEPGWMAQPDRGALFRIDFTGPVPFELRTIRARPRGFRVEFTTPADPTTAGDPASYRVESHRYESTGAYGSPELDRAASAVGRADVSADGRSVELAVSPLVEGRVYLIDARGVRSSGGAELVHPAGAYTLNEIPADSAGPVPAPPRGR